MRRIWFALCVAWILWVAAYDSLRCVADAQELLAVELNPLARLLIRGTDVSLLVCCKSFGVGVVTGVLCELRANQYRHTGAVVLVLVVVQTLVLLSYHL